MFRSPFDIVAIQITDVGGAAARRCGGGRCPLIYRSFIVHLSGFIYRGQYRRTYLYRSLRYSLSIDINVLKGYYESGLSRLVIIYCYFTIALLRIAILSIRAGRIIGNLSRTDYRKSVQDGLSVFRVIPPFCAAVCTSRNQDG